MGVIPSKKGTWGFEDGDGTQHCVGGTMKDG